MPLKETISRIDWWINISPSVCPLVLVEGEDCSIQPLLSWKILIQLLATSSQTGIANTEFMHIFANILLHTHTHTQRGAGGGGKTICLQISKGQNVSTYNQHVCVKLKVYAATRRDSEVMNRLSAFHYEFSYASLLWPFSKWSSHKANYKFLNLTSDLRARSTRFTRHVHLLHSITAPRIGYLHKLRASSLCNNRTSKFKYP
jgi:hypothetical protein